MSVTDTGKSSTGHITEDCLSLSRLGIHGCGCHVWIKHMPCAAQLWGLHGKTTQPIQRAATSGAGGQLEGLAQFSENKVPTAISSLDQEPDMFPWVS